MRQKVRVGVIGANAHTGWAHRSHLPALVASPDCELTAVCTTRRETAEQSRQIYKAQYAFHDYRDMLACSDIDLISVALRVPFHYEVTKAALDAGKHVYTEWPLGKTTAEAEELATIAKAKGVTAIVGLQARVNPTLMYMRELIAEGYLGKVLSCHISLIRGNPQGHRSTSTWQRDMSLGQNTLTTGGGHTLDTLRFVVSDFSKISAMVATQSSQWLDMETNRVVDVTSPDNVLINARLRNGAIASIHVAIVFGCGSGYRMEVYGNEGTLITSSNESPQLKEVTLHGARRGAVLSPIDVPKRFAYIPSNFPMGSPYYIGQMYHVAAKAIISGHKEHPTFDTAVELHRIIDAARNASDSGKEVTL